MVDVPRGPVDYSSATDDQGDMDGYGATDERAWDEMDNEEVQDQYNCTDQCDGNPVEICSHFWHTKTGKLWVITHPISGIEEYRFKAETFKMDHEGCLALYIMDRKIGMKRSRNVRTSREAREWRGWAEKFTSNSKKRMARLVRIFGKD